jgi:DNA-binding MarR family transcriptional regulator
MTVKRARKHASAAVTRSEAAGTGHETDRALDLGCLEETVGFHLRVAQEMAFRAFVSKVGDFSTPPWRFAILVLIDANPGLTQVALARATKRDTSSLTPALDDLCRRGLVNRIRQLRDRRSYALSLTALGKKEMLKLKASAMEHERDLDRLVGRAQRADFLRTLKRIAAGLEADDR